MTKEVEKNSRADQSITERGMPDLLDELSLLNLDPDYQRAWETEISSRLTDFETGKETGVPWEEVRRQLDERREK